MVQEPSRRAAQNRLQDIPRHEIRRVLQDGEEEIVDLDQCDEPLSRPAVVARVFPFQDAPVHRHVDTGGHRHAHAGHK